MIFTNFLRENCIQEVMSHLTGNRNYANNYQSK